MTRQGRRSASGEATATTTGPPGDHRPVPGVWELDTERCRAEATIRHALLTRVRGTFAVACGTIVVAPELGDCSVEATITTASVDTGDARRDEHLRSQNFLDVERFPLFLFHSTEVHALGEDRFVTSGDLTIRGQTRPAVLVVSSSDVPQGADGRPRVQFRGHTEIEREDFGLTWNQMAETGGMLLGRTVNVSLTLEAVLRVEQRP